MLISSDMLLAHLHQFHSSLSKSLSSTLGPMLFGLAGELGILSGTNAAMTPLPVVSSSSSKASSMREPFKFWEIVDFALVGGVEILLRDLLPVFRAEVESGQDGLEGDGDGDGGARTAKSELDASESSVDARLCTRPPCICSNFLPTDFPTVSTHDENVGRGKGLMLPVASVLRPGIEEGGGRAALDMVAVRL